jgi:hypothetical protein
MSRVQFRIGTLMLVTLFFGIYFGMLRTYLRVTGISGLSVGAGGWNLPVVFLHVTRSVVRNASPVAIRGKVELFSGASVVLALAGALTGIVWRRRRARRERLDRQFAMQERVDSDNRGHIRGLAQFIGPNTTPRMDQCGEPERV